MKRKIAVLCLCLLLAVLAGCGKKEEAPAAFPQQLSELAGKRVGIPAESVSAAGLKKAIPDVQVMELESYGDLMTALESGVIDAIASDEPTILTLAQDTPKLRTVPGVYYEAPTGFVFAKTEEGTRLKEQMDAFLTQAQSDGTLTRIQRKWLAGSFPAGPMDFIMLEGNSPVLRVATDAESAPFGFVADGAPAGYETELLALFCQQNGYGLEFENMAFGSIISSVNAGFCDVGAGNISITAEREEIVQFSQPSVQVRYVAAMFDSTQTDEAFTSLAQLNQPGIRLGVQTGTIFDQLTAERFPMAQTQMFNTASDMMQCVIAGKLDGFILDKLFAENMAMQNPGIAILPEIVTPDSYGFAFPKTEEGDRMCAEMNDFLARCRENGQLDAIKEKWLSDENTPMPDTSGLTGERGHILLALESNSPPCCFGRNGEVVGMDMELIIRFCEEYGYDFSYMNMSFDAVIPSLNGVCNMAACGISITEERREQVNLSDPYYNGGLVMVVAASRAQTVPKPAYNRLEQLNRQEIRLGVLSGMTHDQLTAERFPKAQVQAFNSSTDLLECIASGKLDGFVTDKLFAENMSAHNPEITYIDELITPDDYGFAFPKTEKGDRLCAEMNEFLARHREDGLLEAIQRKWLSDDNAPMPDVSALTGEQGTLRVAFDATIPPCCFIRGEETVGMDLELIIRFCQEYGYRCEYADMSFDAVIPSLNGVCDIGTSCISITEERREMVNLSDPYYNGGAVMMVRNLQEQPQKEDFLSSLKASFEKTFIRESRWKLIVNGIGVTVKLSLLTALFGTALGFGLCLLRRLNRKWVNALVMTYVRILQGTPIVVLLMILFYVVFAKSKLSGQVVAVIAFSMNFAAYVSEIMRAGIESVDRGQTEAALALGYTRMQTFYRIVMPQAAMQFLPVYKGEFISLVKTTSIVGYIAVQDLTKASDIIRSRTYEAFFPLIATAIIYFLISNLLTAVLSAVELKIRPNLNNRSVKGVVEKGANRA